MLAPDRVCDPPLMVNPPLPLKAPEKLPVAALKDSVLAPRLIAPAPEIPPSATGPPAFARLKAPLAAT